MACAGDGTQKCGAGYRLSLYKLTTGTTTTAGTTTTSATSTAPTATGPTVVPSYNGWTSQGCYQDPAGTRAIPNAVTVTGGATAMTVEKCVDACRTAGYTIAGLEYAQECYCGTAMPGLVATDGRCSMACTGAFPDLTDPFVFELIDGYAGNNKELCGGSYGLNVYKYGGGATTSTTPGTTTRTTTTTTSASATPTGPTVLQTYGNWQSQGCYIDNAPGRSLPNAMNMNGANTPQKCMDAVRLTSL
jgi:hypothetical protein